ncbi:MAG TPA: RagB/SusD family nutrient uptake outer membrane protein [Chitinophaga sp.]
MTVAFCTLLFITAACKKSFLEVVPKGKLIAQSYEDYDRLMNGSTFYVFNNRSMYLPAALMGDDVAAEGSLVNDDGMAQAKSVFQWDADIFKPIPNQYSTDNPLFLITLLSNMYTLNKIITEVNDASTGTPQQKLELQAEAMVSRAFAHFLLINYFAKPYAAATAGTDPGFPMITTADITANNFKRGTVQEMYDFIIRDITTALPNLNVTPSFRTRWSRAGAEGFLGKVYLFMGKPADALDMLQQSFRDVAGMTSPPQLYDYNVTLAPGGSFLPIDPVYGPNSPFTGITDITESVVAIMTYDGNNDGNNFGNDFLTLSPQAQALFGATDKRLLLYTDKQQDQTPNPGGRIRRFTAPYSFYARIGVELPELYLLKAEAEARTGDLTGAKTDVETLRQHRMPAADAAVPAVVAGDKTALIRFIIDERTREFAGLGQRWFDMRRLSEDPLFQGDPPARHVIYDAAAGNQVFTLLPERLTLRIPQVYLKANPGMEDNP